MKRRSVLQGVFTVLLTGCFLYFVLPYLLTIYLREVLKTIPGYYTKFESVQINFLKGAYTIDSLNVYKTNGIDTLPFINAPRLELSLDWDALLDGHVASKIELKEPSFNFIFDRNRTRKQDGEFVNWTGVLTRLQPLRFNRVCVKNATVSYYDFTSAPRLHLFIYQLQLDIQDLISNKNKEGLPSRLFLHARSKGNGVLSATAKMSANKSIPDLELCIKLEHADMKILSDLFEAYGGAKVSQGNFSLFSEISVMNGQAKGYIKPLLRGINAEKITTRSHYPSYGYFIGNNPVTNKIQGNYSTVMELKQDLQKISTSFIPSLWLTFRNTLATACGISTKNVLLLTRNENNWKIKKDHNSFAETDRAALEEKNIAAYK